MSSGNGVKSTGASRSRSDSRIAVGCGNTTFEDGKPVPFDSEPESAYRVCMQKTCTQLYQAKLWKCPALAYFNATRSKV